MKLLNFIYENRAGLGLYHEGHVLDLTAVPQLPYPLREAVSVDHLLQMDAWDDLQPQLQAVQAALEDGAHTGARYPFEHVHVRPPVPIPNSFRDAYAFRQHVETARRNRGLEMIPEFDEFPVFYFSNANAIVGPGPVEVLSKHLDRLDFELEVAAVIGKRGRNITAAHADDYIAGFCVLNDFSARGMQMAEMKLNLGPAKGKDFASALGPFLVPSASLQGFLVDPPTGHTGAAYDLAMTAALNGTIISRGNLKDMHWTFAEIIERVSYGVEIFPGDVIGSGTVGTGCLLELNGTAQRANPDFEPTWLQLGDEIALEVEALGRLVNTIERAPNPA